MEKEQSHAEVVAPLLTPAAERSLPGSRGTYGCQAEALGTPWSQDTAAGGKKGCILTGKKINSYKCSKITSFFPMNKLDQCKGEEELDPTQESGSQDMHSTPAEEKEGDQKTESTNTNYLSEYLRQGLSIKQVEEWEKGNRNWEVYRMYFW